MATREIWELPHETHHYIVWELAGLHLQTIVLANKVGFYRRLRNSNKVSVRNLFAITEDNLKTTMGRSIRMLRNIGVELGLMTYMDDPLDMNISQFRRSHRQVAVPKSEVYRLSVLDDLLCLRSDYKYFEED